MMDFGEISTTLVNFINSPAVTVPTGVGTTIGAYVIRSYQSRAASRTQIATQLIDLQRNLANLAFADRIDDIQWKEEKPEWVRRMIFGQFFARCDDIKSLAVRENFDPAVVALVGAYRDTIDQFSEKWVKTKRRAEGERQGFWNDYNATKTVLHKILKQIGKHRRVNEAIIDGNFIDINSSRTADGEISRNALHYSAEE